MAGYTDVVFRALCTSFGCDLTCTEMISAKGLTFKNVKTAQYLSLGADEDRIAVQLFGHEPDLLADAVKIVSDHLGPRLNCIDVNMGCPAHKIVSNGDGSALMRTPALAGKIIETMKAARGGTTTPAYPLQRFWSRAAPTRFVCIRVRASSNIGGLPTGPRSAKSRRRFRSP